MMPDLVGEAEDHRALFEHVGVSDPTDWRTVALRLAERYAPHALQPRDPSHRGPGAPKFWNAGRMWALAFLVDEVRRASAAGEIRGDLETDLAVCRYIAGDDGLRDLLGLKRQISGATLRNKLIEDRNEIVASREFSSE